MKRAQISEFNEALVIEATKSSGFLVINKTLLRGLGLVKAVFISYLVDKHIYWRDKNEDFDGSFFCIHKQIINELGISEHQIRLIKKQLVEDGYITLENKGVPAKEFYRINFKILHIGLDLPKTAGLDLPKTAGLNNKDTRDKDTRDREKEKINKKEIFEKRKQEFISQVNQHENFQKNLKDDFCDYWTETKPNGFTMRWEMQPTFDIQRRLNTWLKNDFNPRSNSKSKAGLNKGMRFSGHKFKTYGNERQ